MEQLLTKKQVADLLGVSTITIDNYVKRGLVKIKIGKLARFKEGDVKAYIESKGENNDD